MRSKMIMLAVVAMLAAACGGAQAGTDSEATTSAPTTVTTSAPPTTSAPTTEETTSTVSSEGEEEGEGVARPSNPGGPGEGVELKGDATAGEAVYVQTCQVCHGPEGTGNVANPGSDDGTVPPLNPIDDTMVSSDYKTFATNIDLFIEHGSMPEGSNPTKTMPALGDQGTLAPQQIADVIAYIISLNAAG